MATENPMRVVDSSGARKWTPPTTAFASSTTRAVADELGLLLRGHHNIDRDRTSSAPNRSGSAPPSMEGSYASFGNLINQNVDYHNVDSGNNWRLLPSIDSGSMYIARSSLSAHEEEAEDEDSDERGKSNSKEDMLSFSGRHKRLVDLIQADFPRTPLPVFSQNHSSSHVKEPFNHDAQSLSLDSLSLQTSKLPEPNSMATKDGPSASSSVPKNSHLDAPDQSALSMHKDEITSKDEYYSSDYLGGGGPISSGASRSLHRVTDDHDKHELGFNKQYKLHPQKSYSQHYAADPLANYNNTPQQGHSKITSVEMQPFVHSLPPLYASTAGYMAPGNSFYPNLGASGVYTHPQYSGYAMGSSFLPPYLAGYPPHTGFSLQFNPNSGQNLSGQPASIPPGEGLSKGSFMQNLNRFYGQHGLTIPPTTFPDPLSLQYLQQTVQDPYGVPMQYSNLPSPGDQKFQLPTARKMGVPSGGGYLSSPTGLGFGPQFPASPLGSPVLPDSPVGGANPFGKRYDFGFSQSSPRNFGGYARWEGQRGGDGVGEYRKHSFLEELKSSSTRRIDLSDIVGRIVEFSIDQHGSRFIQQKLESCNVKEKELVFKEVLPHSSRLVTDVFGNYVIQKFFEHGTFEQRKELANCLSGQMLPLSLQMYGCRVIQKALEVIEVDQKTKLVVELDGHIMRCVRDQNGNHVIQKCIECLPVEKIDFIISAFQGQVATLSTHPYGCRVIQRVLEHCSDDPRCRSLVDEILESSRDLAQDQYGNYVTQHVLERGKPFERSEIISKLSGKVVQMSQHKYASNVVEKCLEFGDAAQREVLIEEILEQPDDSDNLLIMMKDQFANYVVQKILEISNDRHRERLLDRIQLHLVALKKYTYGKHIVARFEQLRGEDDGASEA